MSQVPNPNNNDLISLLGTNEAGSLLDDVDRQIVSDVLNEDEHGQCSTTERVVIIQPRNEIEDGIKVHQCDVCLQAANGRSHYGGKVCESYRSFFRSTFVRSEPC